MYGPLNGMPTTPHRGGQARCCSAKEMEADYFLTCAGWRTLYRLSMLHTTPVIKAPTWMILIPSPL